MKGFLTAAAALLAMISAYSQNTALLERMYEDVSDSCVEMTYTYSTRMYGTKAVGSGTLMAQGKLWQMDGNGLQMWCDSEDVWVVDSKSKEVVIEPAADGGSGYTSNPALLFINLQNAFKVSTARDTDDGGSMLYVLVPQVECPFEYANVVIRKSDASITSGSFILKDGNVLDITVSSMKCLPKKPKSEFRPKTSFGQDWIVTDLR